MTTADPTDPVDHEAALTPRQREVVALLARDLTQRQVALRLGISSQTVKNHVGHALAAIGCQGIVGLTAIYWGGEVAYPLSPAPSEKRATSWRLPVAQEGGRTQPPWATMEIPTRVTAEEVVASRISVDDRTGCWLWNGPVGPRGPRVCIGSKRPDGRRRAVGVRRWLYERFYDPLPAALRLYGECRSPRCVNPHPDHARVAHKPVGIRIAPAHHVLDELEPMRTDAQNVELPLGDDEPVPVGQRLRVRSRGSHLDGALVTVTRCYRMPRFDNWPTDREMPWVYRVEGPGGRRSSMAASQLRVVDDDDTLRKESDHASDS